VAQPVTVIDPLDAFDHLVVRIGEMRSVVEAAPHDDLHRAEGVRYLLRFLSAGIAVCVEHDEPAYPEIGTFIENRRSWGLDNPDTKYGYARLAPGASYRIAGDPGTACAMELQVNTGHMSDGNFAGWNAVSRLSTDDLVTEADGSITIDVAPVRPAGSTNWMATDDRASYLHVREYFGDWDVERPAVLAIEPLEGRWPPPPLGPERLLEHLELLEQWITVGLRCWDALGRGLATTPLADITPFLPPLSATGLGGQAYGMGAYACEPDQAVIVELTPPAARYWSLSLATWFWESSDVADRQCSLNHEQAVVDDDGVVRAVISHRDPGVANWLDPAGYPRGTLAVRYLFSDSIPTARVRSVAFDDLLDELPDSARVTPDERELTLRRRRRALVWRYRR